MRIEYGNPYRYIVNQNLANQPEKTKREIILSAMKKEQTAKETMEERRNEKEAYLEAMNQQLKISGKQAKAEKEKLKVLVTCLEIARRISGGDKVPQADHQYLIKHDSALYARSIMMRFPKNDPHEYKQLSEDSDCQDKLQVCTADEAGNYEGLKNTSVHCGGAVFDVNV
ncbi:MAG TPA: hypothetical protein DCM59_15555 [Clostridium sp.]|nr:hypothetical protein [Clostridium sp.]